MADKSTIILHVRDLTNEELRTVSKLFPTVVPFLFAIHEHKTLQDIAPVNGLLTIDISRNQNLKWYKEQIPAGYNIIILCKELKKSQSSLALNAIGMLHNLDETITCFEQLVKACKKIKICSSLCCF